MNAHKYVIRYSFPTVFIVVLAITALNRAHLLPGSEDRRSAETAKMTCMANLRQLGGAIQMYADDSDGYFPSSAVWVNATLPYTKEMRTYSCPAGPQGVQSYAFNSNLGSRLASVDSSSLGVIAFFDSKPAISSSSAPESAEYRHFRGLNVVATDGAVTWVEDLRNMNWGSSRAIQRAQ